MGGLGQTPIVINPPSSSLAMAPSHVPPDRLPLQTQGMYNDPAYEHLFQRVNQYGTPPSWDQFNQNHSALLSQQTSGAQSWHHNALPQQQQQQQQQQSYSSVGQPYANASHAFQTTPSYQYHQFNTPGTLSNYGQQQGNIDPALGQDAMAARQQQQSPYQQMMRNVAPQGQPTVTPQALQQSSAPLPSARPTTSAFQIPKSTTEMFSQRATPTSPVTQPVSNPKYDVPKGKVSSGVSIIDQAALAKATQSTALNNLVNLGAKPILLATNRTALPIYNARQSAKELKRAGASNKRILDKLAKKPSSTRKILLSKSSAAGKLIPGSPSALHRDVSDSDSYSDSDDSEYTSDEDEEPSPLPSSRPDEPHEAVRYDVIKATWSSRKSSLSPEKIKVGLADLWEVLNTIQKRWRTDSKAVTEAEEQKKTGELPVLKSRVTSQRDLLQSALQSALEFAHPNILFHVGKVKPFLYLCYQFLANRFKMQDYDGGLPSVIYQVLARGAGTLTNELIEETKLVKALNSMKKNANDANKALIQQIIDGATAGSKKPKVSSPLRDVAVDPKNAKRPAPQPADRPFTEAVAFKKLKTETGAGLVKKATTVAPVPRATTAAAPAAQKRTVEKPTVAPTKARGNHVVNKPSTFFSTLNATSKKPTPSTAPPATASKPATQQKAAAPVVKDRKPTPATAKPAFSFAETMAQLLKPKEEAASPAKPEKQLPPETPEEKAKRLRKESRRHLRVSFRPDATLVNIRYFHHDPEEEIGHDENFVRDAGDIGGEGRMFKQHRELEEDDDDDEPEVTYRPWRDLTAVDFSVVDEEERKRNFEPYGGGLRKPECPEKEANQRRENSTLMVFYIHPSDIPSSPREPLESQMKQGLPPRELGAPPQFVLDRSPKTVAPAADFSSLESIFNQFAATNLTPAPPAATQNPYVPPQPAATPAPNLSDILKSLQTPSNQQAPAPVPASAPAPASQPLSGFSLPGVDLNAIISAMQQGASGGASFSAAPTGWPPLPQAFPQQQSQPQPQQAASTYQQQQPSQFNQQASGGAKRQREDGSNNYDRGQASFKKQKGNKNHHFSGERPHKVVPCRFFQKGQCTKGDDCTYIHDRNLG